MKKLILFCTTMLITYCVFAQSVTIMPGNQTIADSANANIILRSISNPDIRGIRSTGTLASPTPVISGSSLLRLRGAGYWGFGADSYTDQAGIGMHATETWTPSKNGTNIIFSTTPNGGISMIERMRIEHNGNVGIGSTSAHFPLHINSTESVFGSTTGAFAVGPIDDYHLNFDGNEINAWYGSYGTELFLNYFSKGRVQIGDGSTGNFTVKGYSNIGDEAPAIKMKKMTGTTAAATTTSFAHGLTDSKILAVDVHIMSADGIYYSPNKLYVVPHDFTYRINLANIDLNFVSPALQKRPYKVLITYEE